MITAGHKCERTQQKDCKSENSNIHIAKLYNLFFHAADRGGYITGLSKENIRISGIIKRAGIATTGCTSLEPGISSLHCFVYLADVLNLGFHIHPYGFVHR